MPIKKYNIAIQKYIFLSNGWLIRLLDSMYSKVTIKQ